MNHKNKTTRMLVGNILSAVLGTFGLLTGILFVVGLCAFGAIFGYSFSEYLYIAVGAIGLLLGAYLETRLAT